jgi:UDP-glucose 4-epimerase
MVETNNQIFVTGGAGYIGSHVVKELIRRGYHPVVYDNLQTGNQQAVKNAPLIQADLADREKLSQTFQSYSIQAVMHFAADCLVNESMKNPLKYINNNVRNGLHLLEAMNKSGVRKFVFSSSCAVYGEPIKIPIPEDHPCLPTNVYGETKWILEKFFQAYQAGKKLDFISLRYFNAAGADPEGELGEDHQNETHLIPLAIKAVLQGNPLSIYGIDYDTPDGTCIRDYIHVTDLAQAHILALQRLLNEGESATYNLGNGSGYSVREVIAAVEKVSAKKLSFLEAPRRAGDPAQLVASSERIRKELGWTPKYPQLESIVQSAWNWHRTHLKGHGTYNP